MKQFATHLVWLLTMITSVHAQTSAQQEKLEQYLKIQQYQTGFSGTVLIQKAGKTVLNASTGMASIEHAVPISEHTIYPVASITKSFTALLTLMAAEEGKLKLTDSLSQYFPQLTDARWRSITIDQLLSHRSGIPHNEGIPEYWTEKSKISFPRVPAMKEIFSLKFTSPPGTRASYSSPGYFVLASVLENLYGKSYGLLLKEKITDQLGLKQTGQLDNITIVPSLSQGYHNTNGKLTLAPYRSYSLMKGSGDMYASAQDLAVFLKNLSGQRWKPEIISLLLTPHSKESIERGDLYGYGWFIREASSGHPKAYYHGGGSYGVSALMAIYPDEKLNIIILSNVSTLPVQELWGDIEKIALGQSLQMPEIRNELPIDPKAIEVVRGTYHASNGMQFTLSDAGGKLYAQLASNPPFEIFMQRPLHFYGKKVSIDLIFELDNNGKAKRVTAKRTGDHFIFFKKQ